MDLSTVPGATLVLEGIEDLKGGRETTAALLVSIGYPRLSGLGLSLPPRKFPQPEHCLYAMLARNGADTAHSRYNALIRRLVSFERAIECARTSPTSNASTPS